MNKIRKILCFLWVLIGLAVLCSTLIVTNRELQSTITKISIFWAFTLPLVFSKKSKL